MNQLKSLFATGRLFLMLGGVSLLAGSSVLAQDQGYKVGEHPQAPAEDHPVVGKAQSTADMPRLARLDYVSGNVTWRSDASASWSKAKTNLSLRPGAQIWVNDGGRAEVRFDDGSLLRLGNGAVATLQTLYSDDQGEFTQIKMNDGLAGLRLTREHSLYQVDTPIVSVQAAGPARVRVGVGDEVEVGVRLGHATINGKQGKMVLAAGDYLSVRAADTTFARHNLPPADSWDRWNDERDHALGLAPPPAYGPVHPVYGSAVWFSLDFPLGPGYRSHWGDGPYHGWDRGGWGHRR